MSNDTERSVLVYTSDKRAEELVEMSKYDLYWPVHQSSTKAERDDEDAKFFHVNQGLEPIE